jgi:branched-chain amino acid transport system ATP-binding protein
MAATRRLREITIQVRAGEVVAILGANGAGTPTLLNAIAGLLRIKAGLILFEGREIAGMAPNCIVELGSQSFRRIATCSGPCRYLRT